MAEASSTVIADYPAARALPTTRKRIDALDMTKGVLVIAMVVYHSFNYSQNYALGFKYLPFLPLSFILITGFLISQLYLKKDKLDPKVHGKLLLRGARLFALFTVLNVLAQVVGRSKLNDGPQGLSYFFDHWFEVYVTGESRLAAFAILLPIAYLLLLAPVLILVNRLSRYLIPACTLLLTIACALTTEASVNLGLISAGFIGIVLGLIPLPLVQRLARFWVVALAAYVTFMLVTQFVGELPLGQLLNACLAVIAILSVCLALEMASLAPRWLVTLGKYSLVAYVAQIAMLQVLSRKFGRLPPFSMSFYLQMSFVFLAMIALAEGLELLRKRARWIDVGYRALFA